MRNPRDVRHRLRTPALGALLLTLLVPLAACGGSPSPDLSSVAEAAVKTEQAGSARFALSFDVDGLPGQTGTAGFTAEGDVDYETGSSRMALDLGSLGDLLGSSGLPSKDTKLELITDGKAVYLRFPLLSGLVGNGKPWLKMDVERVLEESGQSPEVLGQTGQSDPSQALAMLKAAGEFDEVGREQVRGVDTTHYTGAIDLRRALDEVEGSQKEQLEQLLEQGGTAELPTEAWIDDAGYLRKLALSFAELPGVPGAGFQLKMEMFDFGVDVEVEPPPADDVTDITDLATKGGLGS